jgi:SAM-dependent methyltransferase
VADTIAVNRAFYEPYYAQLWKVRLQYDPVSKRNLALRALRRWRPPPPPLRILDIGFGSGLLLFAFAPAHALYGVELARSAVAAAGARARRLGVKTFAFHPYDGRGPLPFPDAFFDLVLCSHVLEHVPDDGLLLAETLRLLRPGGAALLNVPLNEGRVPDPHHVRRYTEATFRDRVAKAGLRILRAEPADRIWNLFGWIFERRLHKRVGPAGFLLSAAVNLYFALIPDPVAEALDRLFDGALPARQLVVVARKGDAPE